MRKLDTWGAEDVDSLEILPWDEQSRLGYFIPYDIDAFVTIYHDKYIYAHRKYFQMQFQRSFRSEVRSSLCFVLPLWWVTIQWLSPTWEWGRHTNRQGWLGQIRPTFFTPTEHWKGRFHQQAWRVYHILFIHGNVWCMVPWFINLWYQRKLIRRCPTKKYLCRV